MDGDTIPNCVDDRFFPTGLGFGLPAGGPQALRHKRAPRIDDLAKTTLAIACSKVFKQGPLFKNVSRRPSFLNSDACVCQPRRFRSCSVSKPFASIMPTILLKRPRPSPLPWRPPCCPVRKIFALVLYVLGCMVHVWIGGSRGCR